MTYERHEPLEATAYKWGENGDNYIYRGFELPCDVRIPPATTIKAGCSLHTLLLALTLEGRPRHFSDSQAAQPQSQRTTSNEEQSK